MASLRSRTETEVGAGIPAVRVVDAAAAVVGVVGVCGAEVVSDFVVVC